MRILGIESSCDETAAAVVEDGRKILSNVVSTQIEKHKIFGGVVPEIASRLHTESISYVVNEALEKAQLKISDIDAIAVTYAPGLIGALLVGVNYAKGLSLSSGVPLVPVHHLRSHIASNYITHPELEPPFMCLVVSGGNTLLLCVMYRIYYRGFKSRKAEIERTCINTGLWKRIRLIVAVLRYFIKIYAAGIR